MIGLIIAVGLGFGALWFVLLWVLAKSGSP